MFGFFILIILKLFALEVFKFWNLSHILRVRISKGKTCFNVKSLANNFHMATKILADFQICISISLGFWLIYFLIWGIFASKFFNLATALRKTIYLMKQAQRLFFEKLPSETLSLETANLPKNKNEFSNFILIIILECF